MRGEKTLKMSVISIKDQFSESGFESIPLGASLTLSIKFY